VAELTLDDDQWDALASHLDRVRMPELVRGEAPPDAGPGRGASEDESSSALMRARHGDRSVESTNESRGLAPRPGWPRSGASRTRVNGGGPK
jgi:hypothetical protein